jgi:hypothetical protein
MSIVYGMGKQTPFSSKHDSIMAALSGQYFTRVLREKWHSGADSWGFDQCAGLV